MSSITVAPVSGALGAEIGNVDLANLDDETFAQIHMAFLDHGVLFFRDQDLAPAQQVAFAKRFGPIHMHPHVEGLPDQPEVMEILKREDDPRVFGEGWHTDQMFLEVPALATILYAKELPNAGGDTLFANLFLAYESLSDGMKEMAAQMRTVNLPDAGRRLAKAATGGTQYGALGSMRLKDGADKPREVEHPLVRSHPETGRKLLYIGLNTEQFADMTYDESQALFWYLMDVATKPEFTCRFKWTPGALAVWDNRCVLHNAVNDYPGQRRRMHRVTTVGDAPFLSV